MYLAFPRPNVTAGRNQKQEDFFFFLPCALLKGPFFASERCTVGGGWHVNKSCVSGSSLRWYTVVGGKESRRHVDGGVGVEEKKRWLLYSHLFL